MLKDTDFLDEVVKTMIAEPISNTTDCLIKKPDVHRLIQLAVDEFEKDETLLSVFPPIVVVGDIHGQFRDLLDLFERVGYPPNTRYLFLGDYVDRGSMSIEVISLLFAMKCRFPDDVYLLRGNHECREVNSEYGFLEECANKMDVKIWESFQDAFDRMPIAGLIDEHIFCVHGGISRSITSFDDIRQIKRPLGVAEEGLACDLLWSDPSVQVTGWAKNAERGVSFLFGTEAVREFCDTFDVDMIIRAHEVCQNGFQFFEDTRLITIFSAPNYAGYSNKAAVIEVDETLTCKVKILEEKQLPDATKNQIDPVLTGQIVKTQ